MAKPEWGTKRICQSCGAKFYDLARSPIVCPSCSAEYDPEALLKSRRPRAAVKDEAAKKAGKTASAKAGVKQEAGLEEAFEADLDDEIGEEEVGEEEDALIEDASELGEDDDLADVKVEGEDEER